MASDEARGNASIAVRYFDAEKDRREKGLTNGSFTKSLVSWSSFVNSGALCWVLVHSGVGGYVHGQN